MLPWISAITAIRIYQRTRSARTENTRHSDRSDGCTADAGAITQNALQQAAGAVRERYQTLRESVGNRRWCIPTIPVGGWAVTERF